MSNKAIDKDYLLRQLQGFEGDVLAQKSIATETGYHNFRYYNNKFSYKNGNTWTDIDVGNTNYTELTQAAYNQLSEAEKNNGTFYFITDSPSGGGGGGVSPDFIAPTESSTTASQAYAIGALFFLDNTLYRVTTAISQGDTIVTTGVSANVAETTVEEELSDKANNTSSFSDASSRTNIASGDTIPTILGKIKKWFTDLADLAFIAKDGNESTKYLRGDGTWQSFPSFSTSLSGLTDTTISSEANKDILEYNSTTSKWENKKKFTALTGTLTAGTTDLSFTNAAITSTARFETFTEDVYIPLLDMVRTGTTLQLTFPEMESDVNVKVLVYED